MRQCELLGLNRSTLYYRERPVLDEDLEMMRRLDEQYTETPFDAGTDAYTLMEIMGHADLKTTMIYVHASGEAGLRAVEKLDAKRHFSHEVVTTGKTADANLP